MPENQFEVELDPQGYIPRVELFARNLTRLPVTFNLGRIRWQLEGKGNPGDVQSLPWTVAASTGFRHIWNSNRVQVALDPDFTSVITTLPDSGGAGGNSFQPFVWTQTVPQSVTTIAHNLSRSGPVCVTMYSPDYQTQYTDFVVDIVDQNTCRIAVDAPLAFVATVF